MGRSFWPLFGFALCLFPARAADSPAARSLKIGVVQMEERPGLAENQDKIIAFIRRAASLRCRVVVLPEGALGGTPNQAADLEPAKAAIRAAAAQARIYVVFGGSSRDAGEQKPHNWMEVADPAGQSIFHYDKIYDRHTAKMPGIFRIDGIPCNGMICADRWLRGIEEVPIMEGAQISFELSGNYAVEWVPALQWYWYVPRAVRNNVYVIFSNTSGPASHGHSAVVAPDGSLLAAGRQNVDDLVTATIDIGKASRQEALRRSGNPVLHSFWEAGTKARNGESIPAKPFTPLESPPAEITVAAAQMACSRSIARNIARMQAMIGEAAEHRADVVVFPALSVTGALDKDVVAASQETLDRALRQVREAVRKAGIYAVFGMPHLLANERRNAAYVVGPDGALLTTYDQLAVERPGIFQAGQDPASMWFRVKGVPCVVTVGGDALWSEIAELTAIAGAQMHFNITYDRHTGADAALRRLQIWANMASYWTFSPTVNAASPEKSASPSAAADGGSAIWEDLDASTKVHLAMKGSRKDDYDRYAVYSPWSANCIVRAGTGEQILYATRRVNRKNPYNKTSLNPQMVPWYRYGAWLLSDHRELPAVKEEQ